MNNDTVDTLVFAADAEGDVALRRMGVAIRPLTDVVEIRSGSSESYGGI